MLTFAVVLTVVFCGFEWYLGKEYPWLQRLLVSNVKVALAFSFALSWAIGHIFPASGLIMLTASVASTLLMQPIYRMIFFYRKSVRPAGVTFFTQLSGIVATVYSFVMKVKRVCDYTFHPVSTYRNK